MTRSRPAAMPRCAASAAASTSCWMQARVWWPTWCWTRQRRRPPAEQASRARLIDNAEGAVNGFWGDYLSQRQNDLDLGMTLRHQGQVLPAERAALAQAYPDASGKLAVFIHGLSSTEWSWNSSAERFHGDPDVSFGSLLQADLGYTPVYVRYNSGQHISHNSRLLSALLAQLVAEYPVPVGEIALIGHSMGGLVARSAALHGQTTGELWVRHLRHIFCLGTPNLGAPLEQSVNLLTSVLGAVDTAGTQVPAQVLNTRSAGIKDLRFGYTLDEEWQGKDPDALLKNYRQDVPLVDGVGYYFVAATLTEDAATRWGCCWAICWCVRPRGRPGSSADAPHPLPRRPKDQRPEPLSPDQPPAGLRRHPPVHRSVRAGRGHCG